MLRMLLAPIRVLSVTNEACANVVFSMLVGYTVKLVSITALYVYMYLENKRRDREASADSEDDIVAGIERGMMVGRHVFTIFLSLQFLTINRTKRNSKTKHLDMFYRPFLK